MIAKGGSTRYFRRYRPRSSPNREIFYPLLSLSSSSRVSKASPITNFHYYLFIFPSSRMKTYLSFTYATGCYPAIWKRYLRVLPARAPDAFFVVLICVPQSSPVPAHQCIMPELRLHIVAESIDPCRYPFNFIPSPVFRAPVVPPSTDNF